MAFKKPMIKLFDFCFSGKGTKQYRFPFDNSTTYGDIKTTSSGGLINIYGRVSSALYLRGSSYIKSTIPFYLECFSNPTRCNTGFTLSFWLFLRSTYSSGTIISADNSVGEHGYKVSYTTSANGDHNILITVRTQAKVHSATFPQTPSMWSHVAFRWAVDGSSMVWLNGTEVSVTWSEVGNTMGAEGDVVLVFASDSATYTQHSDMAIDEFYFREMLEVTATIATEFGW